MKKLFTTRRIVLFAEFLICFTIGLTESPALGMVFWFLFVKQYYSDKRQIKLLESHETIYKILRTMDMDLNKVFVRAFDGKGRFENDEIHDLNNVHSDDDIGGP